MWWEYLVLGLILGWAVYYLRRRWGRRQGGCSCGSSCPADKAAACGGPGRDDGENCPEGDGGPATKNRRPGES